MLSLLFFISCDAPCETAITPESGLVSHFLRLDKEQCLHPEDIHTLEELMNDYHKQTTLHCDEIWRRSSIDGKWFDGPEEKVLESASVPDVWILPDGSHLIAYNDLKTGKLVETALSEPQTFWRMGLVGYGGLGLVIDKMDGSAVKHIKTDLHLKSPQEVVDPDIGMTKDNHWRLVWFGVNPTQMNPESHGPLNSSMPHYFYRSVSSNLEDFGEPQVILKSSEGTTGGADPAMLNLQGKKELLLIGPLDVTVMAWESEDGVRWDTTAPPSFNTRVPLASPDAVVAPDGTYRLYGMENGNPGNFVMYESKDTKRWKEVGSVYKDQDAFNISAGVDPVGTWWIYYNKTNEECLQRWGSKRILPVNSQGTRILPASEPGKAPNPPMVNPPPKGSNLPLGPKPDLGPPLMPRNNPPEKPISPK